MSDKFNNIYKIETTRLKAWDYTKHGKYFVTICIHRREEFFGEIIDKKMFLSDIGKIADVELQETEKIRKNIKLDKYVIMPNHIHGIVMINKNDNMIRANSHSPLQRMKPKSISSFIAGYKSVVTKRINQTRNTHRQLVWQRNYYEHIIRDEKDLNRIREYIVNNPVKWEEDEYYKDEIASGFHPSQ